MFSDQPTFNKKKIEFAENVLIRKYCKTEEGLKLCLKSVGHQFKAKWHATREQKKDLKKKCMAPIKYYWKTFKPVVSMHWFSTEIVC